MAFWKRARNVLGGSLGLALAACHVTPPIPAVQVIRYPNRIQPAAGPCRSGSVPVLQPTDPIDEDRCFQFGDVFLSRSSSGRPCSKAELEATLARTACAEGASLARILHVQSPETSGSDCYALRAALFECIAEEPMHAGDGPDA